MLTRVCKMKLVLSSLVRFVLDGLIVWPISMHHAIMRFSAIFDRSQMMLSNVHLTISTKLYAYVSVLNQDVEAGGRLLGAVEEEIKLLLAGIIWLFWCDDWIVQHTSNVQSCPLLHIKLHQNVCIGSQKVSGFLLLVAQIFVEQFQLIYHTEKHDDTGVQEYQRHNSLLTTF